MHSYVLFDGEMILAGDARLSALSAAALYGRGVFTTIAIIRGKPLLLPKHIKRLSNDAARIGLDPGDTIATVADHLSSIIAFNELVHGRARVTVFDDSPSAIWPAEMGQKTSVLITTADTRPVPHTIRVEISDARIFSLSKMAGIKSCNYLDSLRAYENARARGFNEAIRLNERGEVVSGCMSNVFWLKDEKLYTPDTKTGCVAGTTREHILEHFACEQVVATAEALDSAEGAFLTSAGLGVVNVAEINGRDVFCIEHPLLSLLDT